MSDVLIVSLDFQQEPTQSTVVVQLNFSTEKVSTLLRTPQAVSYTWDIAQSLLVTANGATRAASTKDTTYTTTILAGSGPPSVLSTRSWSQIFTQTGTTHVGAGGGAGKPSFSDIVAETRTGPGTLALLRGVTSGVPFPTVEIAGCESSTCTAKTVLTGSIVTKLVLGSPSLFDQVQFNYPAITWNRDDDGLGGGENETFTWNVATNTGE